MGRSEPLPVGSSTAMWTMCWTRRDKRPDGNWWAFMADRKWQFHLGIAKYPMDKWLDHYSG
eukprot:2414739-Prorocentrum_lima.AAC.1